MRRWSRVFSVFLVMVFVVTTAFSIVTQLSTAKISSYLKSDSKKKSKVLIAYFGRYGNTNFKKDVDATTSASIVKDGKKKRGTTDMLARLIQKETGGDLFRIQTKQKYPASYNKVIDLAEKEQRRSCHEAPAHQGEFLPEECFDGVLETYTHNADRNA